MARESRRQGGDRLRLPPDHHRTPDKRLAELKAMIDQGVTSFKLFMAYPGVFLVDDGTIFKAMSAAGERGGLICMHAENGVVIDEIVKRALAEGKHRAEVSRADAADRRRSRRRSSRDRDRRDGRIAGVHRPLSAATMRSTKFGRRAISALPAFAETCPQYLFLDRQLLRERRLRRREVRHDAAAAREVESGRAVERTSRMNDLQVISTDHCPFCFKEQKELGRDDFTRSRTAARASSIA